MTAKTSAEQIAECRRLRSEGIALREISAATGVSLGTVSGLVRDIPLDPDELLSRKRDAAATGRRALSEIARARRGAESPYWKIIQQRLTRTDQKGAVAEAAAIFRAKVWGMVPHIPLCGGESSDLAVFVPGSRRLWRLQVKCARRGKHGMPGASLKARSGGKQGVRYLDTAFDFFVGYDLCEDICYVYSMSEIIGNRTWKAMDSSAAERWDKLL